jgi:hypothetical protein
MKIQPKLKTAQLFLYIAHVHIFNDVFPVVVLMIGDAVQDETGAGNTEGDAQASRILIGGKRFMQVRTIDHVEKGIAHAANHKNGPVGDERERPAFCIECYLFNLFVMHAHDIGAGSVQRGNSPDGWHLMKRLSLRISVIQPSTQLLLVVSREMGSPVK